MMTSGLSRRLRGRGRAGLHRTITRSTGVWKACRRSVRDSSSMCSAAPSTSSSAVPSTSKYWYGSSLSQTLIDDPRVAAQVAPLGAGIRRVEDDVLAVGVDPDDARLRAPALVDRRDDAEVEPLQQLHLLVG